MIDTDLLSDTPDELDQAIDIDSLEASKRFAVRYQRDDIQATLKIRKLFARKTYPVTLLDISSKGAAIVSTHPLTKNTKVSLHLSFKDGQAFDIDATVVRLDSPEYGLRFQHSHGKLADHLLDTQSDLKFG
ncbi:MAG: hypothetical protein RL563_1168 [Pseudomonadota bacterium]|jgi:hypothetical protein